MFTARIFIIFNAFLLMVIVQDVTGHGRMVYPPGRSSVWRYYDGYPVNFNDNQLFCGGLNFMISRDGRCGVCGDPYGFPHPQPNENTGIYGGGKVVAQYKAGQIINAFITLDANHLGTFEYSLCILKDPRAPEPGEKCFKKLKLEDGSDKFHVSATEMTYQNRIRLPSNVTCERCVLRWHYRAGNNWGQCEDGTYAPGCGYQETFRSCADVAIHV